jgi:hypothetical protein
MSDPLDSLRRYAEGADPDNLERAPNDLRTLVAWVVREVERLRAEVADKSMGAVPLELVDAGDHDRVLETARREAAALGNAEVPAEGPDRESAVTVSELRRDAAALARIVRTVGELQLQGAMTDDVAHQLIAAVEGEHQLVVDGDTAVVWPEPDLAEVAAKLDRLRAQGIESEADGA